MAYVYLNLNPLKRNTGDCVVRALAFATNRSWDDIYWELCEKGFERAEMPSWNSTWWDVLKDLGFTRHIIPDTCPSCYTVDDFCKDHPEGKYVLFIPYSSEQSGHVVAVEKGNVYDTWNSTKEVPLAYWRKE
jgi:hypothetical protein